MSMDEIVSPQVDSLLSDGLDPPGNVCPHSHLPQSGDHKSLRRMDHNYLSSSSNSKKIPASTASEDPVNF